MKLPQIDTIRDNLKVIDNQGLYKIDSKITKKAKRNKVFEEGSIDGYTVAKRLLSRVVKPFIREKYIFVVNKMTIN